MKTYKYAHFDMIILQWRIQNCQRRGRKPHFGREKLHLKKGFTLILKMHENAIFSLIRGWGVHQLRPMLDPPLHCMCTLASLPPFMSVWSCEFSLVTPLSRRRFTASLLACQFCKNCLAVSVTSFPSSISERNINTSKQIFIFPKYFFRTWYRVHVFGRSIVIE